MQTPHYERKPVFYAEKKSFHQSNIITGRMCASQTRITILKFPKSRKRLYRPFRSMQAFLEV